MNKKNFFEGSIYSAPEMEMIPVIVEAGICVSGDINDVIGDNTGDLDD